MRNTFLILVAALLSSFLLGSPARPVHAQEYHPVPTARKFPYVGACLSDQPRLARVPGRVFDNFAGQPTNLQAFLASNGFNAVRLLVNVTQPAAASGVNNQDIDHREANYLLDFGSVDWQVAEARQAKKLGQRVVLTLQFGQEKPLGADNWHEFIPESWLSLNYVQMLGKIDAGTRRMLLPFLKAGVQPDILIVENESDSGMLFQTVSSNGKMVLRNDQTTNPFSDAATGSFSIWPKCAGCYKREILSAKDEIMRCGFDPTRTRIAVHGSTTPGHARFLFNNIFRSKPNADSVYYSGSSPRGVVTAVPAYLRKLRLADMVDVMGFSFYPDPPRAGTAAAFQASLRQMTDDLAYYNTVLSGYGRYPGGPYRGQDKKQSLVIEFGVPTDAGLGFTVPRQQRFVTAFFNALAAYPWTLGALWWEPGYARNNWSHGEGSLYRVMMFDPKRGDYPQLKPITTIKTWGTFAGPR